ncbi:sensor histidine kinase [Niallia sp. FSL R7-0271]|uniref:sensor histidine kinase n=1 Tax=Niallia sp. FSL R7-0271 TaxID=2921678 RepID=UPI0030F53591
MNFWQKIFLSTFFIFITLFDIAAFVLISSSYHFSLQREEENSIREQSIILKSIENSISQFLQSASYNKEQLTSLIKPLANYYENQNVYLALYNENTKVYSNTPILDSKLLGIQEKETRKIQTKKLGGKRYLFVSSPLPSNPNYSLVYARNISQLDVYLSSMSRVFVIVSILVCIVLGILNFIFLKRLTGPLNKMISITSEIANGAFHKRVHIKRRDDLGTLGSTFNKMADSIEDKVGQLTKESQNKQQFIDNLAHEMKTPLTSILGYSEYLQKAKYKEKQRLIATQHLNEAAERLQKLSIKLLDLTSMRTKNKDFKEVNMEGLFAALYRFMNPILKKKNIHLEIRAEVKSLLGDETLLLSLLINLVENSARASKDNDLIAVRSYVDEKEEFIVEVKDYGIGLDKEEIKKITEPFYRVDKSHSREFGGFGLGLSIVAQIAKYHNADLDIQSQKGTTIRIIFNKTLTT